ncbi:MAG TPA: Xaa-Pro peptidase family protein [Desulfosporosinus sp.]|nr:Xaa-Pro peptidase family protein [Desulfosporosinus sp.]
MYQRVIEKVKENHIDAYLIQDDMNKNWLCNIDNYSLPGIILVTTEDVYLVTPSRNIEAFRKMYSDYHVLSGDINTIFNICKEKGISTIGFESNLMSVDQLKQIEKANPNLTMRDMPDFIEDLRMIKTPEEIELIQEAVALSDNAYLKFLDCLKIGMTEREAKTKFYDIIMQMGADRLSFDTLLSSGKRCFLPHSASTDKVIEKGDLVLMDFGIVLNGYCSDTTRTVVMGEADGRQKEMYNLVLVAQENALKNIKAGITARQGDAFARDIITEGIPIGCFDYGLGHGIGMSVHEKPRMHPNNEYLLYENTVMSIEPGIYIEGWGGIRIEDLLVIKKDNPGRNLTKCPKELIIIK